MPKFNQDLIKHPLSSILYLFKMYSIRDLGSRYFQWIYILTTCKNILMSIEIVFLFNWIFPLMYNTFEKDILIKLLMFEYVVGGFILFVLYVAYAHYYAPKKELQRYSKLIKELGYSVL